jgi:hypothetical protein
MRIAGSLEDIKDWLDYASLSKCELLYVMPGGHLYFLYAQGRYVYVKANWEISNNAALTPAIYYNLLRFLRRKNAEMNKKDKNERQKLTHVNAKSFSVEFNGDVELATHMFTYLKPDGMYSRTAKRLEPLQHSELRANKPTLRLTKSVITQFVEQLTTDLVSEKYHWDLTNYFIQSDNERENYLLIDHGKLFAVKESNALKGWPRLEYTFEKDYQPLHKGAGRKFYISDSTLAFVNGLKQIHKDDVLYLIGYEDHYAFEWHRGEMKMKIFTPRRKTITTLELLQGM